MKFQTYYRSYNNRNLTPSTMAFTLPINVSNSLNLYGYESILSFPREWCTVYASRQLVLERICQYIQVTDPSSYESYLEQNGLLIGPIIMNIDREATDSNKTHYISVSCYSHFRGSAALRYSISRDKYLQIINP